LTDISTRALEALKDASNPAYKRVSEIAKAATARHFAELNAMKSSPRPEESFLLNVRNPENNQQVDLASRDK
jgi:hypothetical protein